MKIVLCGSTRFIYDFNTWNAKLTEEGHIVYSVAHITTQARGEIDPDKKIILDLVHLRKILESDVVIVLNRDGYIGDSTWREILWAQILGKDIYFLETVVQHGEKSWIGQSVHSLTPMISS